MMLMILDMTTYVCFFWGGETFPPLSRLDSILQDFLFKKHEQGIVIR